MLTRRSAQHDVAIQGCFRPTHSSGLRGTAESIYHSCNAVAFVFAKRTNFSAANLQAILRSNANVLDHAAAKRRVERMHPRTLLTPMADRPKKRVCRNALEEILPPTKITLAERPRQKPAEARVCRRAITQCLTEVRKEQLSESVSTHGAKTKRMKLPSHTHARALVAGFRLPCQHARCTPVVNPVAAIEHLNMNLIDQLKLIPNDRFLEDAFKRIRADHRYEVQQSESPANTKAIPKLDEQSRCKFVERFPVEEAA
ncbi:hypothetical protein DMN91_002499 [Ooceraea biroi]|uniref:Uncharacterized protein n=1 Tax=Ooceraea biroi TaxID=2015173 RepID=A0A3L8DV98_OOCBI|nr:hypothetical protein DMN91_002499 [Ooceraea biroi]